MDRGKGKCYGGLEGVPPAKVCPYWESWGIYKRTKSVKGKHLGE